MTLIASTGTIDIKRILYDSLSGDGVLHAATEGRVRIFSEYRDPEHIDERLPGITIARVSTRTHAISGLRIDLMQVTVWAKTMREAEELAHHVARVLNRSNTSAYHSCTLEWMDDTHDDASGAYWVHSTYRIASLDSAL